MSCAIGSLTTRAKSVDPKKEFAGRDFVYVDIGAVDQDRKMVTQPKSIPSLEAPSRARQLLAQGDILVSTVRPNLNAVALVGPELDGAVASTGFCVLRPKPGELDGRFLFQWVKSRIFIDDMVQKSTGASYPAVSDRIILESLIPGLTIEDQRRIAAMLDMAEGLRTKRRATIALLDQLPQAIFLEMFGDPETNPMNLAKLPIGSLANIKTGGTPSRTREDNYGGAIPWVKTGEVTGHPIRSTEESLTEKGLKSSNCQLFPVGSVVIAMYGQGKTRGRCSVLEIEATTNQACAVVLPSSQLSSSFLFEQLSMSYEQLRQMGRGGNQPNLNLSLVSGFEVLVPPKEQQEHFAVRVEAIHRAKADQQSALIELDALFAALQGSSFQGAKG